VKKYCLQDPNVSEIGYNKWIKILEPVKLEDGTAYLTTENEFTKNTAISVYMNVLKRGFLENLGFEVNIEISTRQQQIDNSEDDDIKKINELKKSYSRANYELTFDNFIKGKSNELAYAFCTAVAGKNENSNNSYTKDVFNPLFIYGDSGLGKTHLLKAIAYEIANNKPEMNVIYTTGENFTNELIKSIAEKDTTRFHEKYRNADFLLVDDVQFIAGKESTQEEFFHTFNELYNLGKQIVLTSDIPPSKMKKLEDRMKSRFVLGVQVDVQPPDFETRMAIVKRKAELLDLQLPDTVARIIAEKIKTNIRQLEGAVNKIKGLTMFSNEIPSISMAQRVIKENLIDNQPAELTVERILTEVGNAFNVTSDDIRSQNRNAQISLARKIAIYVIREVKGLSYTAIGNELKRDHSTMTISYHDVKKSLSKNSDLKETVDDIIKNLKEK
jgi:chromosomal replication initiator protein